MKARNNSNNVIKIGILNLLPGQTVALPAPYEHHPIVKMFAIKKFDEDHALLTLIRDAEDMDGQKVYTISRLKRFSRQKVEMIAKNFGIDLEGMSKEQLIEAIFATQADGNKNGSEE